MIENYQSLNVSGLSETSPCPKNEYEDIEKLPIEAVVERMLVADKCEWKEAEAADAARLSRSAARYSRYSSSNQTQYNSEERREHFTNLETKLRTLVPELPSDWDSYEAAGGIKLTMGIEKIEAFLQEKVDELRKSGILMFRSEFEQKEDPQLFRTPGKIFNEGQRGGQLDRLWGAEYLRKELKDNESLRVPRYIVVIEDGVETLPISVSLQEQSALIHKFDSRYGEVLVENIKEGKKIAETYATAYPAQFNELKSIGYLDFSDNGNILEKDGKHYVVDTDSTALGGATRQKYAGTVGLLSYARQRYKVFYENLKPINVKINNS